MTIRVVPFARLRELLGASALERTQPDGATAGDLWASLAAEFPALGELAGSTRLLRNDVLVARDAPLSNGDEVALLPPFGGG